MSGTKTLLKSLLVRQHWQKYETFCTEYKKVAQEMGREFRGSVPSKAQFYRWLSGQLRGGVPYPDACRVLEKMFPDWTAAELFAACPDELDNHEDWQADRQYADVVGVFVSRAAFSAKIPPVVLFDRATSIRAAGLSLNILCQQYSDEELCRKVEAGACLRCLFLDPKGDAIRAREREEGHPVGLLSTLTDLNIRMLIERVRPRLQVSARERLQVATYDETVRFNIVLIDDRLGVVQPYLPHSRGVDAPTLVLEPGDAGDGLFPVFSRIFEAMWERSRPL